MKNKDYKIDFEEHRKEIELDNDVDARVPSRMDRHGRQRKSQKSSSYTMINVILGVFTFIPILIFVFVIYNFYFDTNSGSANDNSDLVLDVSPGKSDGSNSIGAQTDTEKEDDKSVDGKDKGDSSTEAGSGKPPITVNPTTPGKEDSAQVTEKPKAEEKPKVDKKVEKKPEAETKPESKPQSATHVVAANETLYRISVNYYGSDAGIEKIKSANGLTSNDIMAGQKLIIPK